jgi:hypothetical protein
MKMFLKNLSIAALVVTLASCGGADGTKIETTGEKVAGSSETSSESKTQSFKLNDVIKLDDYVVTVTKIVDNAPHEEYLGPEPGKKFVSVEVLYENRTSDKTLDYSTIDWKLSDGDSYNYDADAISGKTPTLDAMGTINPGQKVRGWVNFQTPKAAKGFKIQFQPNWLSNANVIVDLN